MRLVGDLRVISLQSPFYLIRRLWETVRMRVRELEGDEGWLNELAEETKKEEEECGNSSASFAFILVPVHLLL